MKVYTVTRYQEIGCEEIEALKVYLSREEAMNYTKKCYDKCKFKDGVNYINEEKGIFGTKDEEIHMLMIIFKVDEIELGGH